ncbi:hypothetical protein [Pseudomonas sp. BGI-2]|uniref:GntT/GntP/DsdX family permease n=1 Tax=Pseudomonas sp. BGI-2 TaxID=2528211 RepID=UPI0015AE9E93|nr:hypothetical protein [Pseudomonas sp. BGI-2]
MTLSFGYWLLVYAAIAIIALIVLIARYRLNPFIVITLVSISLALLAGMPPSGVVGAYEAGVGKTLGHIALVVALGTMLGKMMAESGGAGSVIFSHVNDGGFWLIKEYFNMTVAQTFKTWTVLETLISVVAFALTVGLSYLI